MAFYILFFFVEAHTLVLLSGWSIFAAEELRIRPICAHTEFIFPNNHPFHDSFVQLLFFCLMISLIMQISFEAEENDEEGYHQLKISMEK
jgi:hypothetical protein